MDCRLIPLGSGSGGNATLVEFGSTRFLVDAGLSTRDMENRLRSVGIEPESIDTILLTHEHYDHSRGLERFTKKYQKPVAATAGTLLALNMPEHHIHRSVVLTMGQEHRIGTVSVTPFPVPHDAAEPTGFVLEGCGVRIGIAVDLGKPTAEVVRRLSGCQILMVEANHDLELLRNSPYPASLKQRVGGSRGHLSNDDAGALLAAVADGDLRAVVLAHLSRKNNTADLAMKTVHAELGSEICLGIDWRVACQKEPGRPVAV
ncbi:MAG: MBL fold metallo-hydrolase [Acidobacteria bacterium]|uniref:MBL fold metallo-hydrolase n=1 Tax=Candidatus Polarisedimenticola svalbardensis TaxID=2886004 RepID=A0A8J7C154_9BACT|nr:MBL fold metallo-hydrolase [Candidatus Polarisedimenticola svalbardensis]